MSEFEPRMLLFLGVVILLTLGLNLYMASRLTAPMVGSELVQRGIWASAWIFSLLLPAVFLLLPLSGRPWADRIQWVGYVALGFWSLIFIALFFRDLLWAVMAGLDRWAPALSPLPEDPERRRFLGLLLNGAVGIFALSVGSLAFWRTRGPARIERVTIPIKDLPPALQGFRIAQISDLHVGPTIRGHHMQAIVDVVNSLDPHLVAVTGDLIDGPVGALAKHVAPLGGLTSRHGSYFVTGNHEYYSGALAWCEHVETALGWTVLHDAHTTVDHDGATILIAGVPDLTAKQFVPEHVCDPVAACVGAPDADLRLLLAHQPETILRTGSPPFHLQLSGHTHGGQYFPFSRLIRLVKRWVAGLYRVGDTWVYVNRGTTWWGPPMRLDSEQEITLLELVAEG